MGEKEARGKEARERWRYLRGVVRAVLITLFPLCNGFGHTVLHVCEAAYNVPPYI